MDGGTNGEKIEGIIQELRTLAARQPLRDPVELARAKEQMRRLRAMGFGVREVVELTGGGWSEATVKLYITGIKITDAEVKRNIALILYRMVQKGLGFTDVKNVLAFMDAMNQRAIQPDDFFTMLEEAKRVNINPADIVGIHATLKSKVQDVEIDQLAKALPYIIKLADQKDGFSPELLHEIIQSAENQGGDAKAVLESINAQGNLIEIQNRVKDEQARLDKLIGEVSSLEGKQREFEANLELYRELESLGYSIETLKRLRQNAEKFGNLDALLVGLSRQSNLEHIQTQVERAQRELKQVQSEINTAKAEHSQLLLAINLCNKLLFELKWSEATLKKVHELTTTYGSPIDVMEALIKYGEMDSLDNKISELSNSKSALESEIGQNRQTLAKLRGKVNAIKEIYDGFTNMITLRMRAITEKHNSDIAGICKEQIEEIKQLSRQLADELAKAKIHEQELKTARYFHSALNAPEEAGNIPLAYALAMIQAAQSIFRAHEFNPTFTPKQGTAAHNMLPFAQPPLLEILEWAKRAAGSDPRALDGWSRAGGAA